MRLRFAQMKFKPVLKIDRERSRVYVGFEWKIEDGRAKPKAEIDAAELDGKVIRMAMRHLVAATCRTGRIDSPSLP